MVIATGCSPQRRLARLLERYPLPETRDTIYIPGKIIYRDTIVFKYLPGETQVNNVYVEVPKTLPDTIIMVQTTLARAFAHLDDNHLGLELVQFDSVFRFKLDSAIFENTPDTVKIETIKEVPKLIPPKPFYKNGFFVLVGLIVLTLFLFFLIGRK